MAHALQTIRLEHYNIHSVLACLRYVVRQIEDGTWQPDFDLLFAIVEYMETFPEVLHHPKEEDYLFAALLRRRPDSAALVDRLCEDHASGMRLLDDVRAALKTYRDDPTSFGRFRQTVNAYVDSERKHMNVEERELLPLAMAALEERDWVDIDAAFSRNDDPVFGVAPKEKFRALFRKILDLAPAPMGFGVRDAAAD